jgi:hypothetical protein
MSIDIYYREKVRRTCSSRHRPRQPGFPTRRPPPAGKTTQVMTWPKLVLIEGAARRAVVGLAYRRVGWARGEWKGQGKSERSKDRKGGRQSAVYAPSTDTSGSDPGGVSRRGSAASSACHSRVQLGEHNKSGACHRRNTCSARSVVTHEVI